MLILLAHRIVQNVQLENSCFLRSQHPKVQQIVKPVHVVILAIEQVQHGVSNVILASTLSLMAQAVSLVTLVSASRTGEVAWIALQVFSP